MKPKILVVDDEEIQRNFLVEVIKKYLGTVDWELLVAATNVVAEGNTLIEQNYNRNLAIAVVDGFLTEGADNPEGLQVLSKVKQLTGDSCYKILVSRHIPDIHDLPANSFYDEFVYLRYKDRRNPVDALQQALQHGMERYRDRMPRTQNDVAASGRLLAESAGG